MRDPDHLTTPAKDPISDRMRLWAKRSAVHYLGTYTSSVENLRQIMERKAARKYPDLELPDIERLRDVAVSFCLDNGFLDDTSYAETKVAAGLRKGYSKRKLELKLSEKGVERDIIAAAVSEVDDLNSAIKYAKRRRIGPWRRGYLDINATRREMGSFGRSGFSGELAIKIINMSLEEAENILCESL